MTNRSWLLRKGASFQRVAVSGAAPEDGMSGIGAVFLVVVAENRHQPAGDLVAQPDVEAAAGDLDLVRRVGELQRVGGAVADGLVERRHERSARLVPVRVDRRERIVSPEVALDARRIVLPAVLRVANHDSAGIGQGPVGSAAELVVVDRRRHRRHPVVAAPRRRRDVRQGIQLQERLAGRADPIGGNAVAGKRLSGQRIDWRRRRAARDLRAAEVSIPLRLRRHERRACGASILQVPLDVAEEMQLVLDDRAAERAAEVVALQLFLRLVVGLEKIVLGIQRVAAARVECAFR